MKRSLWLLAAAGAVLTTAPAAAVNYRLQDGNSSTLISDRNGAIVWNVDQTGRSEHDAIDNVFMSNYLLRIGSTAGEKNLFTMLGTPTVQRTANSLSLAFADATLSATLQWSLIGGTAGSGRSVLTKSIAITNLSQANLDLHLFDYSDYDINFDQYKQADQATLVGPGHIVTTSATAPFQIDSTVTGSPDHYQITDFYTLYSQLFLDSDGPTTLSDTPAPGTPYPTVPKDNAFAFQWNRALGAGQTLTIAQVAAFGPSAVPEPSGWVLLLTGFGLGGGALRRQRRQRRQRSMAAQSLA